MNVNLVTFLSKFGHSSLALRYLKAVCNTLGFVKCDITELPVDVPCEDAVSFILRKKDYNIIGFSVYIWNFEKTIRVAEAIKKVNKDIFIVLGGPEISYLRKEEYKFLRNIADCVVIAEGEETFKELLICLKEGATLSNVKGLYLISDDVIFTGKRELIENLDTIPSPYFQDLIDLKKAFTYYESSRGCPFNCGFCLSACSGKVRFFSKERVFEELKYLLNSPLQSIRFADRTMNFLPSRMNEIIEFILKENRSKKLIQFEVAVHLLNDSTIELLKQAPSGTIMLEIGIQSTDQTVLNSANRNFDINETILKVKKLAEQTNVHLHLDILLGLPAENKESFYKTLSQVLDLNPHTLEINTIKVLHGTPFRKNAVSLGITFMPSIPYAVLSTKHLNYFQFDELRRLSRLIELLYTKNNIKSFLRYAMKLSGAANLFTSLFNYWTSNNYKLSAIAKDDVYRYIMKFCKEVFPENFSELLSLLKHDYIMSGKTLKGRDVFYKKKSKTEKSKQKVIIKKNEACLFLENPLDSILKLPFEFTILKHRVNPDTLENKPVALGYIKTSTRMEKVKIEFDVLPVLESLDGEKSLKEILELMNFKQQGKRIIEYIADFIKKGYVKFLKYSTLT